MADQATYEKLLRENEYLRQRLEEAMETIDAIRTGQVDALVVQEASVGKGLVMKRFATRARGRSAQIIKPFSRIRIVVREQEEA